MRIKGRLFFVLLAWCFASATYAQEPSQEQLQEQNSNPIDIIADRYESIMFYKDELKRVNAIIDAIKNQRPLPIEHVTETGDIIIEGGGGQDSTSTYIFPQFYLKSIAYYGADNWVAWINNTKITSDKKDRIPKLVIDQVTRDKIWLSYDFEGDTNIRIDSESADPRIQINQNTRHVTVVLEPNQTFSLFSWQIFEGYVKPVTKMIKQEKEEAEKRDIGGGIIDVFSLPKKQPEKQPEKQPDTPLTDDEETTGFQGLLNRYKKLE